MVPKMLALGGITTYKKHRKIEFFIPPTLGVHKGACVFAVAALQVILQRWSTHSTGVVFFGDHGGAF